MGTLVTKKDLVAAKELVIFFTYKRYSQYIKCKLSLNSSIVFDLSAFRLKLLSVKIISPDIEGNWVNKYQFMVAVRKKIKINKLKRRRRRQRQQGQEEQHLYTLEFSD